MMRKLLALAAVAALMTLTVVASAAPPGNDRFTQTWGSGEGDDFFEWGDFQRGVSIGFSTDDHGNNMWVDLYLWTDTGYGCSFSGLATRWEDDTELQEIGIELDFPGGVEMEGGEPGEGGTCGDALIYALITVDYSGADTSKWHTNSTGSQCRGNNVIHEDAYGEVVIDTVDHGRFEVDEENTLSWYPNYYTSEWRCHSTGTPGNPH